jgi:glycosyltransferase
LEVLRDIGGGGVRVISEPDRGIYDAMNKGLRLFTGNAVGFLNADDRFASPRVLDAIAAGLTRADMVFGDLDVVSGRSPRQVIRRWRTGPFRPGAFRRGWMPPHPTFYCQRQVIERVGGFDPTYVIAADYDFMLRCLELTDFRSEAIAQVLVDMRAGGKSTSSLAALVQHNLEALRSRRRCLGAASGHRSIRQAARQDPAVSRDRRIAWVGGRRILARRSNPKPAIVVIGRGVGLSGSNDFSDIVGNRENYTVHLTARPVGSIGSSSGVSAAELFNP